MLLLSSILMFVFDLDKFLPLTGALANNVCKLQIR